MVYFGYNTIMYIPTQNGIKRAVHSVRYTETAPPDTLAELVHCFWWLRTDMLLPSDFHYHVLPDACVDIVFDLSSRRIATIMTPYTTSTTLNLGKSFRYVGIRLLPGVWRDDIANVVGGHVDVSQIGTQPIAEVYDRLCGRSSFAQQKVLVQFTKNLTAENVIAPNKYIMTILDQLDTIHTVADMAHVVKLSPRQLQRIFKQMIGFSPHDFLKVVRLQQSFNQHYLTVYTDQSHFIRSFRRITGYTPKSYAGTFDV